MTLKQDLPEPTEWFERHHYRHGWYGYTEEFSKYPSVKVIIPPFNTTTHELGQTGWRMNFKQKTSESRVYLHFHNKINFGFRVRLPANRYAGISDFFYAMPHLELESSQLSVTNVVVKRETEIVKVVLPFEVSARMEREAILKRLGDYRGKKVPLPDNVVDLVDYLPDPQPIDTTEAIIERLNKAAII